MIDHQTVNEGKQRWYNLLFEYFQHQSIKYLGHSACTFSLLAPTVAAQCKAIGSPDCPSIDDRDNPLGRMVFHTLLIKPTLPPWLQNLALSTAIIHTLVTGCPLYLLMPLDPIFYTGNSVSVSNIDCGFLPVTPYNDHHVGCTGNIIFW